MLINSIAKKKDGICANNFSIYTFVESIIKLTNTSAKVIKVLSKLKMHQMRASYKMTHELARTLKNELVSELCVTDFSYSLDEVMSLIFSHVILWYQFTNHESWAACLFKCSICWCSISVCGAPNTMKIEWENLLFMLMDSTCH